MGTFTVTRILIASYISLQTRFQRHTLPPPHSSILPHKLSHTVQHASTTAPPHSHPLPHLLSSPHTTHLHLNPSQRDSLRFRSPRVRRASGFGMRRARPDLLEYSLQLVSRRYMSMFVSSGSLQVGGAWDGCAPLQD